MAAIGCGPQKRTGMGPVQSPAAVTIPLQKAQQTTKTTPKATEHTQTQPNKQKTRTKTKNRVESDRRSSSVTIDEGEVIALYQLEVLVWQNQTKRENTETQKSHCHTVE